MVGCGVLWVGVLGGHIIFYIGRVQEFPMAGILKSYWEVNILGAGVNTKVGVPVSLGQY